MLTPNNNGSGNRYLFRLYGKDINSNIIISVEAYINILISWIILSLYLIILRTPNVIKVINKINTMYFIRLTK